jgi:hypothetical protein
MSYEFFSFREVTGRKAHTCEQCHKTIEHGERHFYCAGKFDGNFYDYREHTDCRTAWNYLNNTVRDRRYEDCHPFLADDDDIDEGERSDLHVKFPAVASRVWPSFFPTKSEAAE